MDSFGQQVFSSSQGQNGCTVSIKNEENRLKIPTTWWQLPYILMYLERFEKQLKIFLYIFRTTTVANCTYPDAILPQ